MERKIQNWKKKEVELIKKELSNYNIIGIVDMTNMPSAQLQQMRSTLKKDFLIKMSKARLVKLAINQLKDQKKNIIELLPYIRGMPALIYTKENPFSYNERKKMITSVLKNNNIKDFRICPVPDLYDDVKWVNYIKTRLPAFDAVYSGNKWTLRCFDKHNFKIKKIILIRGISSTKIRDMIAKNKDWKKMVPKDVADYIKKTNGTERIKKLP